MKALSAGSEIDAWCTKCKMDLGHRIVAMLDRAPKRVVCLTCDSTHNYRPPKTGGVAAARSRTGSRSGGTRGPTAAARAQAASESERFAAWERHIAGAAETAFKRYNIEAAHELGDLVLHKKFGEGYVIDILDAGKIAVMFRDQQRTLVHGHK